MINTTKNKTILYLVLLVVFLEIPTPYYVSASSIDIPQSEVRDQKKEQKEQAYFRYPVLFGSQNSSDIVLLQEILVSENLFDEKPSGNFSYKTRLGLMKLQKRYTLPSTGSLNQQTLQLLRTLYEGLIEKRLQLQEGTVSQVTEIPSLIVTEKSEKLKSSSFFLKIKEFFE